MKIKFAKIINNTVQNGRIIKFAKINSVKKIFGRIRKSLLPIFWLYGSNQLKCLCIYLVYWPQPVPPVVILWSDETLVVPDVMIGYISVIVFPSLWDNLLVDPSTIFWCCEVIDNCLDSFH